METEQELFWTGLAREIIRNQASQKNAQKRFRGQVSVFPDCFGIFAGDCLFKTVCFCFGDWIPVSKGEGWIMKLAMWQISNENQNVFISSIKVENISPATKSNWFRYWKKSKAEKNGENESVNERYGQAASSHRISDFRKHSWRLNCASDTWSIWQWKIFSFHRFSLNERSLRR
jgi:hypothetical protein